MRRSTFFPMVLKHICWHQRYGDSQDSAGCGGNSFKEHWLFCIKLDHYHLSSPSKFSLSSVSSLHPSNSQSPFQNTSFGSQLCLYYIFFFQSPSQASPANSTPMTVHPIHISHTMSISFFFFFPSESWFALNFPWELLILLSTLLYVKFSLPEQF